MKNHSRISADQHHMNSYMDAGTNQKGHVEMKTDRQALRKSEREAKPQGGLAWEKQASSNTLHFTITSC